jgi:hypothetical protein
MTRRRSRRPAGRATERENGVFAAVLVAGSEKAAAHSLGLSYSTVKPEASRVLDFRARIGGVDLLALGLLLAIVTWFPYRAGQRWSWGALWVLPGWAASFVVVPLLYGLAPGQSLTAAMVSGPILALLAAAALVVDAGRFGSKRVASS